MHKTSSKTNHLAVLGFILPFVACALVAAVVLATANEAVDPFALLVYLLPVPMILLAGLYTAWKSIPLIEERGDRDYAYAGLFLNILFLVLYSLSLLYVFFAESQ